MSTVAKYISTITTKRGFQTKLGNGPTIEALIRNYKVGNILVSSRQSAGFESGTAHFKNEKREKGGPPGVHFIQTEKLYARITK